MATQREISGGIKDVNAASGTSSLGRLSDLHDFKVAEGYPDIRGWNVQIMDGSKVGTVDDLIVDTSAMRVRYLNVKLDRSVVRDVKDAGMAADGRHTLLPIGAVALDERDDHVVVNGYTLAQIAVLPVYDGQAITGAYETSLRRALDNRGTVVEGVAVAETASGAVTGVAVAEEVRGNVYDHADYDDQRLYAPRRAKQQPAASAQTGGQRLTLAEEQLSVGKRQVSGGEVELRKTVDVEHVQEQVQLTRDEVTVERRPLKPGESVGASINADEIHIPVMEEQVVMQKIMVPREEIIVRKTQVTDQQTVQADLRKERLEVDDSSVRASGSVGTTGTSGASGTNRSTKDR